MRLDGHLIGYQYLSIPAHGVPWAQGPFEAKAATALAFWGGGDVRTYVYVDGFNLYYRALKGGPYKWLNLRTLISSLLLPENDIEVLRYFTARVAGRSDPDEPRRQQLYLNALNTLPGVTVHFGRFLTKTKFRPLVVAGGGVGSFVEVHDTEEKGSDVNLAAHLLNDGWRGRYDVAVVVSQDTDLVEPIRMVRDEIRKPVGLIWCDGGAVNGRLERVASFVRHITPKRLADAQFATPIMGRNGHLIYKPASW
ncbi:MAG: NYN domain-containing protein [Alphaproteobacteria bacterium]